MDAECPYLLQKNSKHKIKNLQKLLNLFCIETNYLKIFKNILKFPINL